ncbi:MAG: GIY-YIG nuclease family protein [Bdellovibrionales bacterium]|nr:GIY-YIG nuclease family protein [Bdellovibrionales bacterium]
MKFIIYKITNKLDGKIYIGKHQTLDPNDDYMGSGKRLGYAKEKYGIEHFEKEVLFVYDNEAEMNAKEAELVTEEFCDREDTYNICLGGQGGWGYVNKYELNNPATQRQAARRIRHKLASRDGIVSQRKRREKGQAAFIDSNGNDARGSFLGMHHTEEWKQRQSAVMKIKQSGNKNSQFGTIWITNGEKNAKIRKDDEIPEGWYRGRKIK